jgi:hypothetical protein
VPHFSKRVLVEACVEAALRDSDGDKYHEAEELEKQATTSCIVGVAKPCRALSFVGYHINAKEKLATYRT